MMSDNRLIMSSPIKRKIVGACEETSKKFHEDHSITRPKISYTEESEEIQIIHESDAVNTKHCLELDTSNKYKNEFLKHHVLTTGRKLKKKYTRNDLKKSSLSVSVVESHFHSGTAVPDLGDIIQVKEYAPRKEEIECYHRLAVEESSPKLISRRDEQNLKKKYSHLEACITDLPVELHPSVSSPCMVSDSQVASGSNSTDSNIYFDDDSWDSDSANVSHREVIKKENLDADSFVINSGNIQNVPLSIDSVSLISVNSNSLRNAANFNLQRSVSDAGNADSERNVVIETIKSRFPLAAKENSDEDLESFNDDNEAKSLEGREEQKFSSSSSAYKAPVVHTETMSGEPKCLVPSRLKYKIGSNIFKTEDVLLLILEWNVDSIIQNKQDFPPISCTFKKVSSSYENFKEYYNSFFPLLMLETRQRVHTSLSRLNLIRKFSANIISYLIEKDHIIVKCESLYSGNPSNRPDRGKFIIVNYGTKSQEHTVKIFGYITHSYLRSFDPKTDSETCKYSEDHTDMESSTLAVLTIRFKVAYDSEHINHQSPVRLQAVYALKYSLKQHDALLSIKNSPYEKYVLKPSTEGLLRFSLKPETTEDQIRKCAENVVEKNSETLITILKTDSSTSQHLEIMLLVIQMLKNNGNNMKVLVCVRTRGTITDIAEKLSSQSDLKFVIMCKRGDIASKFRKFVFDDLVSKKKRQVKDIRGERKKMKGETKNIKKEIMLECDVVILWERGLYNSLIAETLSESKSIDNTPCIIYEAHSFTEPETFIPTLYGNSRLILIGSTADKPRVLSEAAITYAYDKSYLERACDSD